MKKKLAALLTCVGVCLASGGMTMADDVAVLSNPNAGKYGTIWGYIQQTGTSLAAGTSVKVNPDGARLVIQLTMKDNNHHGYVVWNPIFSQEGGTSFTKNNVPIPTTVPNKVTDVDSKHAVEYSFGMYATYNTIKLN